MFFPVGGALYEIERPALVIAEAVLRGVREQVIAQDTADEDTARRNKRWQIILDQLVAEQMIQGSK